MKCNFIQFIDNLAKASGQYALCEAVKKGYKVCYETSMTPDEIDEKMRFLKHIMDLGYKTEQEYNEAMRHKDEEMYFAMFIAKQNPEYASEWDPDGRQHPETRSAIVSSDTPDMLIKGDTDEICNKMRLDSEEFDVVKRVSPIYKVHGTAKFAHDIGYSCHVTSKTWFTRDVLNDFIASGENIEQIAE